MQKLGLNELRERYLSFFESKGHLRLPSFSLVPQNDNSLLLINAGMTPLKPYFTGAQVPPRKRVTTCQKCIRTPDIDNVGKTARHGTFFEMLGNFSFGDYFKKEVIPWAWEFITEDLKIPKDRLYVTIYLDDDEAFEIWNKTVGLSEDRIFRMGKEDNFWEHGTGPCGPCSEIFFDRGPDKGCGKPDCKVGCDCDRYIEFWNLVFTQFDRDEAGNYNRLPNPNIDTGMGLERLACIMQDVDNLFEVDTIREILNYICKLAKVEYNKDTKKDISIRVITDHIRSTTMMVSDGVLPSNEGRGYVLRRLLRRAARHGKMLGIEGNFLHDVAKIVIRESKGAYPELAEKQDYIEKVIKVEEERFQATIDQGLSILNQFIAEVKASGANELSGEMIFKLHDTYGFPLDLTREIAEESGIAIDEQGFTLLMKKQKESAKEAHRNKAGSAWSGESLEGVEKSFKTKFIGYGTLESSAKVEYIIKDGKAVDSANDGDMVTILLDVTPFYGESGGQSGDVGRIYSNNFEITVEDTKKTADGKYLHIGTVESGVVEKGDTVTASVDRKIRHATARNHTATHLLQKALRNALGEHVHQSGSHVANDRLRFDFTHFSPMTAEEIEKVENEVNEKILEAIKVDIMELPIEEAKKLGATALFGEKYGDIVRVVKIGDYSMEFCGGTHLSNTAEAGFVKVLGESGVAAGVRRIEALTGRSAINYYKEKEKTLNEIANSLKTSTVDAVKKVEGLTATVKEYEKEIEQLRGKLVSGSIDEAIEKAKEIKGFKVVTARFDALDMDGLRNSCDNIRNKMGSGVVVLASSFGGKVSFVAAATKDAVGKGVHSGNIVREVAKVTGGGGGGRPDMAQAGGKEESRINEALEMAYSVIESQIK